MSQPLSFAVLRERKLLLTQRLTTTSLFTGLLALGLISSAPGALASPGNGATTTTLYSGSDGTVEYDWYAPAVGSQNYLGTVHVSGQLNGGDTEIDVPVGVVQANAPAILQSVQQMGGSKYVMGFMVGSSPMYVTLQLSLAGKTLNADLQADQPLIGGFYGSVRPSSSNLFFVNVPYYSENVVYFRDSGMFGNSYFDWQYSNSTQIYPMQAAYYPLTNGVRNSAKDRLVLSVSQNIGDVLPTVNNHPSYYQSQLAGRTVLDIWNQGNFGQIARALNTLGNSGLQNCVVLIHSWQQYGYDNALPSTFPASASQGGNSALARAVATGQKFGCYVGVHENYVDYYPDSSNFTGSAVALNSDSTWRLAWFNPITGIQSFAAKQTWILPNAAGVSPLIHSALNTNASFIDVVSASDASFHVDMDATQAGAGSIATTVSTNKSLWAFEQQNYGGPVFGEGLNHWYWSGLTDGVEAQFGAGNVNYSQGELNPLFVDFDLLKIHPLQVNHGMGMYSRWIRPGEDITQTNLLDAYRMQEVIYGHAPYINGDFWNNPYRVLEEQNLVSPVAQRYGTQPISSIQYQVNGTWTNSNVATQAGDWSRVSVQYANGDNIVANAQSQPLYFGSLQLPQYGWAAQGNNLLAYTALLNGQVVDYAQSGNSYYANARNQADLLASGAVAQPSVQSFTQLGVKKVSYQMQWQVLDGPQGENLSDFIHFVDGNGNIAFQGDYPLSAPTTQWKPGQVIADNRVLYLPSNLPDGMYSMRVGLYSMVDSQRVKVIGIDDGTMRYAVGNVFVSNGGQYVWFQPIGVPAPQWDGRTNTNGSVVNFGTIQTDGMVSVNQNGNWWSLRTYPRSRNVVVQLNTAQFAAPAWAWCDSVATQPSALGNGFWQIQTNGAQSCTWPAQ